MGNKLSNVRSSVILRSGEDLTSFNGNNRTNFSDGEKKHKEAFWYVYFFSRFSEKNVG